MVTWSSNHSFTINVTLVCEQVGHVYISINCFELKILYNTRIIILELVCYMIEYWCNIKVSVTPFTITNTLHANENGNGLDKEICDIKEGQAATAHSMSERTRPTPTCGY